MNIVAIDPSLSCTAMVVNDKKFVYTSESTIHTKKGELKRWFERVDDLATFRVHPDIPQMEHAKLEIFKLQQFRTIVQGMFQDIWDNVDRQEPTKIAVEGYSYSSAAGPLIDLVTFGTMIRLESDFMVPDTLEVYQPTILKLLACQLTYPPTLKGKKVLKEEWRNYEGVAGGSFKKHEIYKALTENKSLNCDWVQMLREYSDEILPTKAIPKPIEDLNDAKILYEIVKKKHSIPQPLK